MSNENNEKTKTLALPTEDFFGTLDHRQVVNHLAQRVQGAWIYQFSIGNKQIVNLGKDGAAETAIALAQLSKGRYCIETIRVQDVTDYGDRIDASVKVGVFARGFAPDNKTVVSMPITAVIGYASQPKFIKARDGREVPVNHPRTQAVHKAERNGINWLVPEKLRQTIIAIAQQGGHVQAGDENTETTTPNQRSKNKATDKQMNMIARLLKDEYLSDQIRDQADEAIKRGLTVKQASDWIGTLQGAINKVKAEGQEKHEPSML